VQRGSPRVTIATHDGSIEALRASRPRFAGRTALALAAEDALKATVDKSRTIELARQLGIAVPRTVIVTDSAELPSALEAVGLPAVLKPIRSWQEEGRGGSRFRAVVVMNAAEAKRDLREVTIQGRAVAVQEWLSGSREAVSLLYANGRFHARFAQIAFRMNPPLGGSSVLRESIPLPDDLVDASERLVTTIGLEGYSEVEFRRGADRRPRLMEINPRLSASVEIAVRAGIDFPVLVYQWAAGLPVGDQFAYKIGLRVRWLGGDLRWLRTTLRTQGRPDVPKTTDAIAQFVTDFLRPTSYDYVERTDMRPAAVATRDFLLQALRG